jgi:hypothetical protein
LVVEPWQPVIVKVYVPTGVPEIPPPDPPPVALLHPVVDSRQVSSTERASDPTSRRRRLGKTKNRNPASIIPPLEIPVKRDGGILRLAVVDPVVEMVRVTVCAVVPEMLTEAGIEQVGA